MKKKIKKLKKDKWQVRQEDVIRKRFECMRNSPIHQLSMLTAALLMRFINQPSGPTIFLTIKKKE